MKKKTILILCIVLAVVLAAGGITAHHFLAKPQHREPDMSKTPIPVSIDAKPVLPAQTLQDAAAVRSGLQSDPAASAPLFGKSYPARVLKSADTYTDENGLSLPAVRWTEYLDENGKTIYTYVIKKEQQAVYAADGTVVYSSDAYRPDADYTTEPMRWFYSAGKLACAELNFYDGENNGSAYYDANGKLLAIRTEYASTGKDGNVTLEHMYLDGAFVMIEEEAFRALIPQTDAPAFLQINWE